METARPRPLPIQHGRAVLNVQFLVFARIGEFTAMTEQSQCHHQRHHDARRWLSIAAGLQLMLGLGSNHAVSAWNAQLKTALAYSQAEISLVCSMFSFGSYFSLTPGYAFDYLGAGTSVLISAMVVAAIYWTMAAGTAARAWWLSAWVVGTLLALLGQVGTMPVLAALGTNEGLFGERHRGKIMSSMSASFSAGGALFAMIYHRWFDQHVANFFVMLGVLLPAVLLFAWVTFYQPPPEYEAVHPTETTRLTEPTRSATRPAEAVNLQVIEEAIPHKTQKEDVDVSGGQLLADSRFWCLFVTIFINIGAALFIMSNISFIAESLQGSLDEVPTLVALFSIANCLGRVCAGAVSDHVVHWWPRINMVSLTALLTAITQALFLILPTVYLAIPVTLAGTADGMMFAVFPVLVRETFGLKHFGKNYGALNIASAIGFPLFFSPISTMLYKHHAVNVDGVEKCFGRACFDHIFVLIGILSINCGISTNHRLSLCYFQSPAPMADGHEAPRPQQQRPLSLARCWLALLSGLYAISAWNAQLKTYMHYSQAEISMVSSMAVMGAYLSWFPGVVFDHIGVQHALTAGSIGLGAVHVFLWGSLTYFPEHVSAFVVGFCCVLIGLLGAFFVLSSLVTLECIFGEANRGKVMATMSSSYSCGGALFAFIIRHGFDANVPGFFFFMSVVLMVTGGLAKLFYPPREVHHIEDTADIKNINDRSVEECDITGFTLLRSPRFWLLFVPVLILIGAGLFVMSNVSFIVESLGGDLSQVPVMVALFSVGNTSARLVTGVASDRMLATCPRAYFGAVSALMTALTHVVFLTIPSAWLAVAVLCAGISEGVMFGTFPVVIREAFGVKHFGKNYGLISFANAIGFPLLLSPFSSEFYHKHAIQVNGFEKCFGDACFRPVFLLTIALCAVAAACCIQLGRLQLRHTRYNPIV
ncbi:TPA: hypothetical protein N0F65_008289 [Lagenidium giganteum]|uniref:Uncharacterized protein n=1 Tax=Lagenidium giganteum TaxID=4803 RepID=A0AAV2YST9_9STRA|nr:TPA: hypothetical protein N0F65_008289 [Lagenidium giganteum]